MDGGEDARNSNMVAVFIDQAKKTAMEAFMERQDLIIERLGVKENFEKYASE